MNYMNYSSNGVTITTVLEKVPIKKKNDDQVKNTLSKEEYYPIKIRITYQRRSRYFTTKKYATEIEWQNLKNTKSKKMLEMRKDIEIRYEIIKNAVRDLIFKNEFSFENLKQTLSASPNKKEKSDNSIDSPNKKETSDNSIDSQNRTETLDNFLNAKIKSLHEKQQIGTMNIYKWTLITVNKLMGKNILLTDITVEWLQRFERKALNKNNSYTTIGMYLRNVRCMLNVGKKQGIITEKQYPFGRDKYIIPVSESRKIALTIDELKAFINCKGLTQTEERYRDIWLFSYYMSGANYTDILQLKYSNIQDGEISYYRQKTFNKSRVKKTIEVFITPEMKAIIQKWGNPNKSSKNYIFPHLKGDETPEKEKTRISTFIGNSNENTTSIAKKLKINKPITTYTARHTYASILKHRGANIAYISESLGHKDLKTTEHYLASFGKDERQKNARLLNPFL